MRGRTLRRHFFVLLAMFVVGEYNVLPRCWTTSGHVSLRVEAITTGTEAVRNKELERSKKMFQEEQREAKREAAAVLGLKITATETEVKNAYRTLAAKHHLDNNPGSAGAQKYFKVVQDAFDVLRVRQPKGKPTPEESRTQSASQEPPTAGTSSVATAGLFSLKVGVTAAAAALVMIAYDPHNKDHRRIKDLIFRWTIKAVQWTWKWTWKLSRIFAKLLVDIVRRRFAGRRGAGFRADMELVCASIFISTGKYASAIERCRKANSEFECEGNGQELDRSCLNVYTGDALRLSGSLEKAQYAYEMAMLDQSVGHLARQGMAKVKAIRGRMESASSAFNRLDYGTAVWVASSALELSPNLEAAQKLILDSLETTREWAEARRRCEVWACRLERCKWTEARFLHLHGFEKGGGPPRDYVRIMHASVREGYCRALRNAWLTEKFKHALAEVAGMGVGWALAMTERLAAVKSKSEGADQALRSGLYEEALGGYSEAIAIVDERDEYTRVRLTANFVCMLMRLGRYEEALEGCKQVLQLKPDYPMVLEYARRLRALQRAEEERQRKAREERKKQEEAAAAEKARKEREQHDADVKIQPRPGGHYATLGVHSKADDKAIKKAYYEASRKHHPDRNPGDPDACRRFREIKEAYDVLIDKEGRRSFNRKLSEEERKVNDRMFDFRRRRGTM